MNEQNLSAGAANEAMARVVKALLKEVGPDRGVTSVEALAAATGIPYGTLRKRMDARQPFDYDQMVAVATSLGVPLIELLTRAESLRLSLSGDSGQESVNPPRTDVTGRRRWNDIPTDASSAEPPDLEARYVHLTAELEDLERRRNEHRHHRNTAGDL